MARSVSESRVDQGRNTESLEVLYSNVDRETLLAKEVGRLQVRQQLPVEDV